MHGKYEKNYNFREIPGISRGEFGKDPFPGIPLGNLPVALGRVSNEEQDSFRTALIDSGPLSYSERGAPSALQQYYYYMAHWPRTTHTLSGEVYGLAVL